MMTTAERMRELNEGIRAMREALEMMKQMQKAFAMIVEDDSEDWPLTAGTGGRPTEDTSDSSEAYYL